MFWILALVDIFCFIFNCYNNFISEAQSDNIENINLRQNVTLKFADVW